jgi:molecular chaperone HscB
MQRTIEGLRNWIEQRKWFDAKAAAIRLRYQQGIDRAAKKWLDNNI